MAVERPILSLGPSGENLENGRNGWFTAESAEVPARLMRLQLCAADVEEEDEALAA